MELYLLIIYIFIFLFGIIFGSFLNVCIYRIPKHETIVTTPSHCMSCGYELKWYDMVPVFSWIFLKGKCRKCGEKISVQYPIVEAINGLACVFIFMSFGIDFTVATFIHCLIGCALFSVLLVLSVIDWRTFEIPIGLNIFILVLGVINFICNLLGYDWNNEEWYTYVIGFFAVSVILLIIFYVSKGRAIGGGDVKLMAVAGLLLGWKSILLAFAIGCILGAIIHPIRMKVSGADKVLAMGPYLSVGIMVAYLYAGNIINAYIGFCTGGLM